MELYFFRSRLIYPSAILYRHKMLPAAFWNLEKNACANRRIQSITWLLTCTCTPLNCPYAGVTCKDDISSCAGGSRLTRWYPCRVPSCTGHTFDTAGICHIPLVAQLQNLLILTYIRISLLNSLSNRSM